MRLQTSNGFEDLFGSGVFGLTGISFLGGVKEGSGREVNEADEGGGVCRDADV